MVSTKGRYALRVMLDLARQTPGVPVPLEQIARRQEISKKYLELILKALVQKGLLKGQRGKGGGYQLTRRPEEYPVGEILELTEGTLAIVSCLQDGSQPCARQELCGTYPMWAKFDRMVRDFFYGMTLADLIGEQK